jgi:hypothetical protein
MGDTVSLAQPKVLDAIIEGYTNLKAGRHEQAGSAE